MSTPLKIVFLGNHTVGVRVLRTIAGAAQLAGVVAHPEDPEDGTRYESVFAEATRMGVPVIRATGKSPELAAFITTLAPDLLWIADYRYLLPENIIRLARRGAVNLHPSLLPKYRGRASINWAILHGEKQLGLTAHLVDSGMDTGATLAQRRYTLDQTEDVGDALDKLYPLYAAITAEVLGQFRAGTVSPQDQNQAEATQFPRRTAEDGLIDWHRPACEVWNLIRAVAAPYPGAFTPMAGGRLRLWKAAGVEPYAPGVRPQPGEILTDSPRESALMIACADAALAISHYTLEDGATLPRRREPALQTV